MTLHFASTRNWYVAVLLLMLCGATRAFAQLGGPCPGKPNAHIIEQKDEPSPDGVKRTIRCACDKGFESRGGTCQRGGDDLRDAVADSRSKISLKASPAFETALGAEKKQYIEGIVASVTDGSGDGKASEAFKRWMSSRVTLDYGDLDPLGIYMGTDRLKFNKAFWDLSVAKQTNLLTFEAGKVLFLKIQFSNFEGQFSQICAQYPNAMSASNLRSASLRKENLDSINDLDGPSHFGYAVRAAVTNVDPPKGVTSQEWQQARSRMQQYLLSIPAFSGQTK